MRGNKTIARTLCASRSDGGPGRCCEVLARTGVRGRFAMRSRHARRAAAATLWLLALAAHSAAQTKTPIDEKVPAAAREEASVPDKSRAAREAGTSAAVARTQSSPEAESPTPYARPVVPSSIAWEGFDATQKLELQLSSNIDWSAVEPQVSERRGNMQRAIGYVVGGLGVVGLATGGVFGYRAIDYNQRALDQCRSPDPSVCAGDGKDLRDQAKAFAGGALVTLAAGAALLVSGIALIVHAPHSEPSHMPLVSDLRLSAVPSLKGANVRLVGAW